MLSIANIFYIDLKICKDTATHDERRACGPLNYYEARNDYTNKTFLLCNRCVCN